VIIDLEKFIHEERPTWIELETILTCLEREPEHRMTVPEVQRFHYLHERTASDLAKLSTFSFEPETRRYLDSLVGRAYGEIHETREKRHRFKPWQWFFKIFPRTFRRHIAAFWLAVGITAVGGVFGGMAIALDLEAKEVILPFPHLLRNPSDRVLKEEKGPNAALRDSQWTFSSDLIAHNTRISIFSLALGMTWGLGTIFLMFYNGVILGALSVDYLLAGEGKFLLGWLLPHGAVEIPAFLIAGQAGLVLGGALVGWGNRTPMKQRLKNIVTDLVTLIGGMAVLLVWAGFVESFLSQYHEPFIPYSWKIALGASELVFLSIFLARSGWEKKSETAL
jgi:uncharacterized membrane protein SpoIIM required for sporulation